MTELRTIGNLSGDQPSVPTGYCVFRSGTSWFALPAIAVREVMPRPDIIAVPGTPSSFSGLCHVRSEFIPVLNLKVILSEQGPSSEAVMLIMDDADGPWSLLIDEAASLENLEISDAPEPEDSESMCFVSGWATSGHSVIQVLDAARLRGKAEQELAEMWRQDHLASHEAVDASWEVTSTSGISSGKIS